MYLIYILYTYIFLKNTVYPNSGCTSNGFSAGLIRVWIKQLADPEEV